MHVCMYVTPKRRERRHVIRQIPSRHCDLGSQNFLASRMNGVHTVSVDQNYRDSLRSVPGSTFSNDLTLGFARNTITTRRVRRSLSPSAPASLSKHVPRLSIHEFDKTYPSHSFGFAELNSRKVETEKEKR